MTQKLKALRGHVRLLPAVMVLGACLLAVKGFDFAVSARAEAAPAATGQAKAVQPKHNTATATATDHDSATSIDTDDGSSTAEVDVLTSLAKRRAKLDARAKALDMRANLLTAAEKRVDAKIADLKALKQQIQSLLGQRDEAERKQVAALVKVYASMKPRDAARIFNSLNQPVLLDVARHMKPDALAPIMAAMKSEPGQGPDGQAGQPAAIAGQAGPACDHADGLGQGSTGADRTTAGG